MEVGLRGFVLLKTSECERLALALSIGPRAAMPERTCLDPFQTQNMV